MCQGLFFIKLNAFNLQLYEKETPSQLFPFEFFTEYLETWKTQDPANVTDESLRAKR